MKRRREVLAALAVAPVLATMRARDAAAQEPPFDPPAAPMLLTRRLVRHLSDGNRIVVVRSWRIRFVRAGRGYLVEGEQVDVRVDAPARLEAFARIERARRDEAMFPLTLDGAGAIIGIEAGRTDEMVDKAIDHARGLVVASDDSEAEKEVGLRFLASLQQASQTVLSRWPRTLFSPDTEQAATRRTIELPGQPPGEIEVRITAEGVTETGLLRWLERAIETRTGGSSHLSEEHFTLAPEAAG